MSCYEKLTYYWVSLLISFFYIKILISKRKAVNNQKLFLINEFLHAKIYINLITHHFSRYFDYLEIATMNSLSEFLIYFTESRMKFEHFFSHTFNFENLKRYCESMLLFFHLSRIAHDFFSLSLLYKSIFDKREMIFCCVFVCVRKIKLF